MSDYTPSGHPLSLTKALASQVRDEFSLVQTAVNSKSDVAGDTYTGAHDFSGASSVSLPAATAIGSVSDTEIGYLDGVTSAIQTQIDTHTGNTGNPHSVTAAQVGLGNVTNESKETMFSSPALTGIPTSPTAAPGTNTTQVATTEFVATSFAPLDSPAMTGTPTVPTAAATTNTMQAASTAMVQAALTAYSGTNLGLPTFVVGDALKVLRLNSGGTGYQWWDSTNGADVSLSRYMLKDMGLTAVDKGNINNATVTFDYTDGSVQTYTATGSTVTWAISNWPPTGNLGELLIIATNAGAYTHSISGITWIKPDGTTTTSISTYLAALTGRTALQTSGVDQFYLWSRDAGTTIYGKLI